jgi:prophage tail gpP-like protein
MSESKLAKGTTRVTLGIGETLWDGWTELEITRSIDRIAGAFALGLTERWPGQSERRKIQMGMACKVAVDGEVLITGWIDDVEINYDAMSHQVIVRGRDRTGDLFDCAAIQRPFEMSGLKLDEIARRLCAPFGIPVRAEVDMGRPIPRFAIQPGETVFDAIERGCRARAVLPVADGLGGLVLTRAGMRGEAAARLQLGGDKGNIKGGSTTLSMKELFSEYVVMGAAAAPSALGLVFGPNPDAPDGPGVAPSARIRDPSVTRYRPTVVLAEMEGTSVTLRQRAEWQRAVAVGKSVKAIRTVQDWRAGKQLWHPNTSTRVTDEFANLEDEPMLIAGTRMMLSESTGTLTELTLALPDAYALIPEGALAGC